LVGLEAYQRAYWVWPLEGHTPQCGLSHEAWWPQYTGPGPKVYKANVSAAPVLGAQRGEGNLATLVTSQARTVGLQAIVHRAHGPMSLFSEQGTVNRPRGRLTVLEDR